MDPEIGIWITAHALSEAEARKAVEAIVSKADLAVLDEGLADEQPVEGVIVQACVTVKPDWWPK